MHPQWLGDRHDEQGKQAVNGGAVVKARHASSRKSATSRTRRNKRRAIVLAAIALAVLAAVVLGRGLLAPAGTDAMLEPAGMEGDLPVAATTLFAAYQANEAAAQQEYGSVSLLVSGTVESVGLDILEKPVVKLRTSDETMYLPASLAEAAQAKAGALVPGDQVELRCAGVSTASGTPALETCTIE